MRSRQIFGVVTGLVLCGTTISVFAQYQYDWSVASQTPYALNTASWIGSQLFILGEDGEIYTGLDGQGHPSSGTGEGLFGITLGDSQYVIVGENTILTSPNGVSWTSQSPGVTITSGTYLYLESVTWTGSQFVTVGNIFDGNASSTNYSDPCPILTSPDGVTWTSRSLGTGVSYALSSVTWTGSKLVAVGLNNLSGAGALLTSSDGITWTSPSLSVSEGLSSVIWTGNQLVAVGGGGIILTSSDGTTWTIRSSGVQSDLNSVTWTGSQLVAISSGGTVVTSSDGVTWESFSSYGLSNGQPLYPESITWTGSKLFTVGNQISTGTGYPQNLGNLLTSSQTPSGLVPNINPQSFLSLKLSSSQLFATLPNSFSGSSSEAAIFSVSGNRLIEAPLGSKNSFSLPTRDLCQGSYILEVKSPSNRIVQPFSIRQ